MYSDQAPAAEAGNGARAESREARDRAVEVKASSSGVCAKRARVSVRREGYQQQQGQEDRQGGQEWWGPWTAAPPLSAAGRGGTEWAVRVGTGGGRWAAVMAIARGGEVGGGGGKG